MSAGKGLVLDANILIRAALGRRVRSLLETYEDSTDFYAPGVCFEDAREYIPQVLTSRGEDPEVGLVVLHQIEALVKPVDGALYRDFEQLVDGRSGFLRQRHCHLDDGPRGVVPATPVTKADLIDLRSRWLGLLRPAKLARGLLDDHGVQIRSNRRHALAYLHSQCINIPNRVGVDSVKQCAGLLDLRL